MTASEVGQAAHAAADGVTDAAAEKSLDIAITRSVKMRLAQDPDLSALMIGVDTDGGRVLLRGSAPNTAVRTKAAELVNAVEGVRAVTNDLSVQAPG